MASLRRTGVSRAEQITARTIAGITGAYFAGLILCNVTKARKFVAKKFTITSYMVFTPRSSPR